MKTAGRPSTTLRAGKVPPYTGAIDVGWQLACRRSFIRAENMRFASE